MNLDVFSFEILKTSLKFVLISSRKVFLKKNLNIFFLREIDISKPWNILDLFYFYFENRLHDFISLDGPHDDACILHTAKD